MARRSVDRQNTSEARFSALYRQTYWKLFSFACRRLDDAEMARDIVAESYRIAWQKREVAITAGLPFLYAICRNQLGNEYQRRTREEALLGKLVDEEVRSGGQGQAELLHLLRELSVGHREVLYLTYWEDLQARDIARVLDCTELVLWPVRCRGASSRLQWCGSVLGNP